MFQASALQTEGPTVPEHDLREFQAFTAAVLPDRGSVVAVYEPASATSYGRYTVGFDAESGAWFVASWKSSIGRAPDRIAYKSDTKSGAIHEWADGAEIGPIGVADYFPFAYLAFFMERPDSIVSLTRTESNGWIVRYVQPGLEGMPENAVEFNGAGLPVRRWREDPNDRRDSAFNYAASFPSGFPIVQNWGLKPGSQVSGPRLVHVEFHERGNPALFERAAVHNTEIDNRAIVETRRQASIAGFTRNDDGTWNPPDQAKIRPYSGDDLRSYRWPLVLAGVTLVVLAGFEIVRRRRGA
ncbi:MAG: hypothetical protein KIS87_09650 [Phycisphaeraceae bacterium]|nr:hypothetical protein [Phycisphaeraceae bacterium]